MPSPLLFFIFIVAVDLILKSNKNKKKAEEARKRKNVDVVNLPPEPRPIRNLRTILEDELNKQKEIEEQKRFRPEVPKPVIKEKRIDKIPGLNLELKTKDVSKPIDLKPKSYNKELKKNLLNGVIFSEILAPPKSIGNQKRSQ